MKLRWVLCCIDHLGWQALSVSQFDARSCLQRTMKRRFPIFSGKGL